MGYDRRALPLQSGIAAVLLVVARFLPPKENINYAFRDPIFGRSWGPAPLHLALVLVGMMAALYWPTHRLLGRMLPSSGHSKPIRPSERNQAEAK